MKQSKVKLNNSALKKDLFAAYVNAQTERLIDYAIEEVLRIGDQIRTYPTGHGLYRTANLLDSLCWGVSYRGELKGSGFYQEQQATQLSYLHEFSRDAEEFPVGGHVLAEQFLRQIGNLYYAGWRVFFAVLAPYWGYWENGFRIKTNASSYEEEDATSYKFLKWAVMTQSYDKISSDLKPAIMHWTCNVDTSKKWKIPRRDSGRIKESRYAKYPRGKGKGKYDY